MKTKQRAMCVLCNTEYNEDEGSYSLEYDESGAWFVCNYCAAQEDKYENYEESDYERDIS